MLDVDGRNVDVERGRDMASEARLFGRWIREVLAVRGYKTNVAIGRFYGMSDVAAYKMTRECTNPSISKAIEYIEPLGYQLAVVPQGSELPMGGVYVAKSKETKKVMDVGGDDSE